MNSMSSVSEMMRRRDTFISTFLALYILFDYVPPNTYPEILGRMVFYSFLGVTFFKMVTKQTSVKITQYSLWYLCFGILGSLSSLYAININYVFKASYEIIVSWIVSFAFVQYIRGAASFNRLFSFYAYSPFFLVVYLLLTGTTVVQGERLGEGLFHNANQLAMSLMLSLFCIFWFIIYSNRKFWFIDIVSAVVVLYIIALTGGRKYLLVPFVFFLFLMIFKNWRNNKLRLARYFLAYLLIMIFIIWAIINIPALYYSIGVRFEGLLSFFNADLVNPDASTVVRYMMIDNGWRWFLERPILGYGLNSFAYLFSQILYDVYAHNNYIEILVDLGIVGFLIYYSFYVYIIVKLIRIQNDSTGIRNFFLAYMLALLVFEMGAVTYQYFPIQIYLGLASAFIWLHKNGRIGSVMKETGHQ